MNKTLQEQVNELCKEHGTEAVRKAFHAVLRREGLAAVAAKFNLVPHTFEAVIVKGRSN